MGQIAMIVFAVAVAVAALAMVAANARLRQVRPVDPPTDAEASFAQQFAQRSLYGVVLSTHHRQVADRRLTTLVYVSRAALLAAVASGLWWKLG